MNSSKRERVIRTGWYCPDCHRVFRTTINVPGLGRFHNQHMCYTAMIRVRLVTA